MILDVAPELDKAIADFWVRAWALTMPDIDFEARRNWINQHLVEMRTGGQVLRGFVHGAEPLGFYTLFRETGLIEQICVSPDAGGNGIGKALIADAALHTKVPLNLVVNEDNVGARRFYEKLGFMEHDRSLNPTSKKPVIAMAMARARLVPMEPSCASSHLI